MNGPVMAGEIDDKSLSYLIRNAFVLQEELYIEEVPRMLAV